MLLLESNSSSRIDFLVLFREAIDSSKLEPSSTVKTLRSKLSFELQKVYDDNISVFQNAITTYLEKRIIEYDLEKDGDMFTTLSLLYKNIPSFEEFLRFS